MNDRSENEKSKPSSSNRIGPMPLPSQPPDEQTTFMMEIDRQLERDDEGLERDRIIESLNTARQNYASKLKYGASPDIFEANNGMRNAIDNAIQIVNALWKMHHPKGDR